MKEVRIIYIGNQLAVHGLTPTSVETLGERLKENFHVVIASSKRNIGLRILHMWWNVWNSRKADYLLIDTYSTSAFFFAWTSALLAKSLGLRYIPILHGGALPQRARKSPARLTSYLKNAYKVVCPSPYLKEEMRKVIEMDYQVVRNAIDLGDYPFTSRPNLRKSGPNILWVRAFDKIYNPNLAIKVLKALVDKGYEQTQLCMVGPDKDGSLMEVKRLAEELNVSDKVKITGRLSKYEWITLSEGYDVFINTTNVDNTPVSVIESLALGLPVVSTNVGGIPHILNSGENAILIDPDNVELFTKAILSLEDTNFYKSLGINGRRMAEGYSWEKVRPQWLHLLK